MHIDETLFILRQEYSWLNNLNIKSLLILIS